MKHVTLKMWHVFIMNLIVITPFFARSPYIIWAKILSGSTPSFGIINEKNLNKKSISKNLSHEIK